jgi:hypothetical protein
MESGGLFSMQRLLLAASLCWSCATLRADFSYQETTQMTGGSLVSALRLLGPLARQAREPIVSTHLIKGNRMATVTKDRTSIVDLDKESITTIDLAKKTYSVMTFAEMKQAMEEAQKKMQERKSQSPGDGNIDASFKVSANATGQTKMVQGLNAKEMIVTMTAEGTDQKSGKSGSMDIVSDAWLAPVPGYEEVKAFHQKLAAKMGYVFGSGMGQMPLMRADVGKGFEEVAKEMGKLDGVPVETTVKMGATGDGSQDTAQTQQQANSQQQPSAPNSPAAALGRLAGIGGLGGFGRNKKKSDDPQQPPPDQPRQQGGTNSTSLIETTSQMSGFSSGPVDASKFEVPAGFKQVQPDPRRGVQ